MSAKVILAKAKAQQEKISEIKKELGVAESYIFGGHYEPNEKRGAEHLANVVKMIDVLRHELISCALLRELREDREREEERG